MTAAATTLVGAAGGELVGRHGALSSGECGALRPRPWAPLGCDWGCRPMRTVSCVPTGATPSLLLLSQTCQHLHPRVCGFGPSFGKGLGFLAGSPHVSLQDRGVSPWTSRGLLGRNSLWHPGSCVHSAGSLLSGLTRTPVLLDLGLPLTSLCHLPKGPSPNTPTLGSGLNERMSGDPIQCPQGPWEEDTCSAGAQLHVGSAQVASHVGYPRFFF